MHKPKRQDYSSSTAFDSAESEYDRQQSIEDAFDSVESEMYHNRFRKPPRIVESEIYQPYCEFNPTTDDGNDLWVYLHNCVTLIGQMGTGSSETTLSQEGLNETIEAGCIFPHNFDVNFWYNMINYFGDEWDNITRHLHDSCVKKVTGITPANVQKKILEINKCYTNETFKGRTKHSGEAIGEEGWFFDSVLISEYIDLYIKSFEYAKEFINKIKKDKALSKQYPKMESFASYKKAELKLLLDNFKQINSNLNNKYYYLTISNIISSLIQNRLKKV